MASPEGRGVLAEYITGTVLGALFIALSAGFIASMHIFDPRSLAMGAGVGSGSMMAAAIGAISAQAPAENDASAQCDRRRIQPYDGCARFLLRSLHHLAALLVAL
jgi:hypothetical protein